MAWNDFEVTTVAVPRGSSNVRPIVTEVKVFDGITGAPVQLRQDGVSVTTITPDTSGRANFQALDSLVVRVEALGWSELVESVQQKQAKGTFAGDLSDAADGAIDRAEADGRLLSPARAASTLVAKGDIITLVSDHGAAGDGATDDTAAADAAIAATPAGGTVRFDQAAYRLRSLAPITKPLTIDLGAAVFTVRPATNGVNGAPVFNFNGTTTDAHPVTVPSTNATTITLSNPAHAALYKAGDWIMVSTTAPFPKWDGTGTGVNWHYELAAVESVSGSVITLAGPLDRRFADSPVVRRVDLLTGARIIASGAKVREVDPGGEFVGPLESLTSPAIPHIVSMRYCLAPVVEGVSFDGWNLHAVAFMACVSPLMRACDGRSPFRPEVGGHGYLQRFHGCVSGLVESCTSYKVRHHVDIVLGSDNGSRGNVAVSPWGVAYLAHGVLAYRSHSTNDTVTGAPASTAGWGLGNPVYSPDYGFRVVRPRYTGAGWAFTAQAASEDMQVIDADVQSSYRGVVVSQGAKRTVVEGGSYRVTGAGPAVLASTDTFTPEDVTVRGATFTGASANVAVEALGTVRVEDNVFTGLAPTTGQGPVRLQATSPRNAYIRGNVMQMSGGTFGVIVDAAPTQAYVVDGNEVQGAPSAGFRLIPAGNLRFERNRVPSGTLVSWNGSVSSARGAGAILAGNSPNTDDGWLSYTPTVQNLTVGNGSLTGRYMQVGRLVHFQLVFTGGTTSAYPGGVLTFGLPVTAATSPGGVLTAQIQQGASRLNATGSHGGSTFTLYSDQGQVTNSSPWSWQPASNNIIRVSGTYEAA